MARQCLNCQNLVERKKKFSKYCSDKCQYNFNARKNYNSEYKKNHYLKNKYGITLEDYYEMVEQQKGRCFICDEEKQLFVDHCHKSGDTRKLLCTLCNSLLGFCKEDTTILKNAINYLQEVRNF